MLRTPLRLSGGPPHREGWAHGVSVCAAQLARRQVLQQGGGAEVRREAALKASVLLTGALGTGGEVSSESEVSWTEKRVVR